MGDGAIGWGGLAASLVLVGVAVVLSRWRRLDLEGTILWSCARALGQLLLVGYALQALIRDDAPSAITWLWVVGMVWFAAATVRRRAPEVPGAFRLALFATAASAGLSLATIFGLGIYPAQARAIVPLAGMMVGNSISGTVLAARRVIAELGEHRAEVEARLALGQPWIEASRSYVRAALRTALTSQIESTKAVGLVFLPGAMTGLILGCVATNAAVVGLGLTRLLFTPDHRLLPLERAVH
jgi:putative ABC transport system permease protein